MTLSVPKSVWRCPLSQSHPYLGASLDGAVYDPYNLDQPFGFLEIKCPYTACKVSPVEACTFPGFFCTTARKTDGKESVVLRTSHSYYAQVQGQMAIGGRPWCDFIEYTYHSWDQRSWLTVHL